MRYIALLRGINVGGNNKVAMPALRQCFEALGFGDVRTYINSGNILFSAGQTDRAELVLRCEAAIERRFSFHVACAVLTAEELQAAVAHAPAWWNTDPHTKNNALFVIAPATAKQVMEEAGQARPEYEKVAAHEPVIFWTAPLATFSRTRYSTIVGTTAYRSVTIRNANTTKKLAELSRQE